MAKSTPRFRKELPAAATEAEGVPGVQVTDPETGTSFTFYEFEYDLAHQLDGRQDYDEVIAWAVANYQTALTSEGIDEFVAKLEELGFLEGGAEGSAPAMSGLAGAAGSAPADRLGGALMSSDSLAELVESGAVAEAVAAATSQAVPAAIGGGVTSRFSSSTSISRGLGERRQPP